MGEGINKSKLTITAGKDGNGGVGDYAKNVKTAGESDVVNVNGYLFYVIDGENYLLGYSGKAESLVLPDSFNGENYRIYDYAFYKQKDITSVTIPNCVTSIGYSAFCDCSSIGSIDIPNSVTSIGEYAFDACGSLESLTIGKGVTEVGNNAFNSCDSLNAVYITDLAAWCKIKFANGYGCNPLSCAKNLYLNNEPVANLVIPDGVTSIGDYTFYGCTSLKSVTMGDSVTSVGDSAFSGCNALVVVIMGSGVTSINECAFYRCNALSSVIVGSGVTSIKDRAFYGCEKLLEVINKSSLNIVAGSDSYGYVGYYAKNISNSGDIGVVDVNGYLFFTTDGENYLVGYVGKDKSLVLPNNYNGKSYQIYKNAFSDNSVITSVTISGNITSIGESAFSGCKSLTSVTISGNVASVDKSAFSGCKSLTSVTISGNDTMTVGESAFSECYSLEGVYIADIAEWLKISFNGNYGNPLNYAKNLYLNNELLTNLIIPDGVTSIGKYAFDGCYSLKSVTIPSSVTSIGNGAFRACCGLIEVINKSKLTITAGRSDNGNIGYRAKNVKTSGESDVVNVNGYLFYFIDGENYLVGYAGKDTALVLPDNYNGKSYRIYKYAFAGNKRIISVTISGEVTSIGETAFGGCISLTSVTITGKVYSIESSAFYGCVSIKTLTLGSEINTISETAFKDSNNLTTIYCYGAKAKLRKLIDGMKILNEQKCLLKLARIYLYSENEPTVDGGYWHYDGNGKEVLWDKKN